VLNIVLVLRRVDGVQAKPDLAARQTRHRATSRDPPSKSPRQNDPHELRRVRRPTGPHRAAMFAVRYEILQITRPKTISARPWQYSLTPQKRGGEFSGRITRILWTLSECKSVRKCGSRTSTRPRPSL
jgi:hypothetical protein